MKLFTCTYAGAKILGAVLDDRFIDLASAFQSLPQNFQENDLFPSGFPSDMITFLELGSPAQRVAQKIIDMVYDSELKPQDTPFLFYLSQVQLEPPVTNPSKVICIGLNYADHCREQNFNIPESLILFAKFPSSLTGAGKLVHLHPESSQQVDYEAELAVVIGKKARNVPEEAAYEVIAGYTIANDVSARDAQFADKQWVRGKSFDSFCPLGPYLVTKDEIPDPHDLGIRCWVNGEIRQDSNTEQMIFKIPEAIAYITRTCTLYPGDLILTGTPDGVGFFQKPPVFLKPGDVIDIEIDRLGRLSNPVA